MLDVIIDNGDQATGWIVRGSNPDREKRSLSSPKRPDWLQISPILLFNM